MPEQEDILEQQKLLKSHRLTLAHYLNQQAMLGIAFMPPSVTHGILEARENIRRIKKVLRTWEVYVENLPNDEEADNVPFATWPKSPVALEEFSPSLLEELEKVTIKSASIFTNWEEYPRSASTNIEFMNRLNEIISGIQFDKEFDIEITCLDEEQKYLVHPWFPKIVGKSHTRVWAKSQGDDFISWFWERVQEMNLGYLTWIDYLASAPLFYSYRSIGEYKRKTIVSFFQVPIGQDCFWTVAVEGHEIGKIKVSPRLLKKKKNTQ